MQAIISQRNCTLVISRWCCAMPAAPAAVTVALPRTSLRMFGDTEFVASLVGSAWKPHWTTATLLLRFVESNGAQTVFRVTGDALVVFDKCKLYKTYKMMIGAGSVKRTAGNEVHGVPSDYVVSIQGGVVPVEVATPSTGLGMLYNFRDWNTFHQIPIGVCFDVVGEVVKPLRCETRGGQAIFTLANRNKQVDILVWENETM